MHVKFSASMKFDQKMAVGRAFLDHYGLQDWNFDVENLRNWMHTRLDPRGSIGYCDFSTKTISVDHSVGRQFRQTMLHEIAHALVGNEAHHGPEWIKKARELGCTRRHLWSYEFLLSLYPGKAVRSLGQFRAPSRESAASPSTQIAKSAQ